jgi:hypothetical protein
MTIRDQLKRRYGIMIVGIFAIPMFGILWLDSSTPSNHALRVTVIASAVIANLLVLIARFKCPICRSHFSGVSRRVLFQPGACACPHCGIDLGH